MDVDLALAEKIIGIIVLIPQFDDYLLIYDVMHGKIENIFRGLVLGCVANLWRPDRIQIRVNDRRLTLFTADFYPSIRVRFALEQELCVHIMQITSYR